ncbi:MAG: glycosyltransferase family 4 protein [Promicromonosporaceae bacterium]|nr:glycosyltransferase family 4 protein [Promicromonosporaceae bacterium]
MKIGIVCPYSYDAPGGVQVHIADQAKALRARGHDVSVLAPADEDTPVPEGVVSTGKALAVPYNGSVARVAFGPVTSRRVKKWLDAGEFDVVHIHEPLVPSISMLALWQAEVPVVATFHSAQVRSRAMQVAHPMMRQSLEKIAARIAVSEDARRTVVDHVGGDAIIIPNGVYTGAFRAAQSNPNWTGILTSPPTSSCASASESQDPDLPAPTIAFLGRLDEPRKGLQVLAAALPKVVAQHPRLRILVAGRGEPKPEVAAALKPYAVEYLGGVSDEDKAALFASVDLYIASQTGGESFGIVLVEAMAAGGAVVASDLGAFRRVLDEGAAGLLFQNEDGADLAAKINAALADPEATGSRREHARSWCTRFDWGTVTDQVEAVYEMAVATGEATEGNRSAMAWLPLRALKRHRSEA